MLNNQYGWPADFKAAYDAATERYLKGHAGPAGLFTPAEEAFLATMGCNAQEVFDFIDDLARHGEPSFETALLVHAVRRDYFLFEQKGVRSAKVISMDSLPPKSQEVDGIAWLPRLIAKAKAKLRGEMPPDLMYGCGGDRPFLEGVNIELAEFLRFVWAAKGDDAKVVDWVKHRRAALK